MQSERKGEMEGGGVHITRLLRGVQVYSFVCCCLVSRKIGDSANNTHFSISAALGIFPRYKKINSVSLFTGVHLGYMQHHAVL